MLFNKRGQFFLLAAVIISAITISFGTITNNAIVNVDQEDLSDYSYDVKREAGNVIDHEIYKGFAPNTNLSDFVSLLAQEVREKDSEINFMFIYGNTDHLTIRNYGQEGTQICDPDCRFLEGAKSRIKSTIRYGSSSKQITGDYDDHRDDWEHVETGLPSDANITLNVKGQDYVFNIGSDRQIIFIIQKEDKDESFVYVR